MDINIWEIGLLLLLLIPLSRACWRIAEFITDVVVPIIYDKIKK